MVQQNPNPKLGNAGVAALETDASDTARKLEQFEPTEAILRPEANGHLYRMSKDTPEVFWIDHGSRRFVPNSTTFENIFGRHGGWEKVELDPNIYSVEPGPAIDADAALVSGFNSPNIYFVDRGQKRFVRDPAAFERYRFDWNSVHKVPPILIKLVRDGSVIR